MSAFDPKRTSLNDHAAACYVRDMAHQPVLTTRIDANGGPKIRADYAPMLELLNR